MTVEARREQESLEAMTEDFVDRLDFTDAVLLLALVKRAPGGLARALAGSIVAVAETEGLAEECTGEGGRHT
jgi:hypothetical protein